MVYADPVYLSGIIGYIFSVGDKLSSKIKDTHEWKRRQPLYQLSSSIFEGIWS